MGRYQARSPTPQPAPYEPLSRVIELEGAHVVHAFQGIFDQCRPDLTELAAVGADRRKLRVEFEFYLDVLQSRVEHHQRVFERLRKVDVLNRRLVHVRVVLDRADKVEDAHGRVDDGLRHTLDAQRAGDRSDSNRKHLRAE